MSDMLHQHPEENPQSKAAEPAKEAAAPSPALPSRKRMLRAFRIKLICFALILFSLMAYGVYVLTPKYDYGI